MQLAKTDRLATMYPEGSAERKKALRELVDTYITKLSNAGSENDSGTVLRYEGAVPTNPVDADQAKKDAEKAEREKVKGDRDGDGIISKREQRRLDLEQERAMRKANSIKGFSREKRGLPAFAGLAELEEMSAMSIYQGQESVGQRWRGVTSKSDPRSWSITPNLQSAFGGRAPDSSSGRTVAVLERLLNVVDQRLTVD